MIWIGDKVEINEVDPNPFPVEVKIFGAIFCSPYMRPIAIPRRFEEGDVELCELTKEGFKLKVLADPRPATKFNG